MIGVRRMGRPLRGTRPDTRRGLARGLLCYFSLSEAGGPTVFDATGNLAGGLALAGGATWGPGGLLQCAASNARAQASWPANLNAPWPLSFACGFTRLGNDTNGAAFGGLIFGLYPSPAFLLFEGSTDKLQLYTNNGVVQPSGGPSLSIGVPHVAGVTLASTTSRSVYLDGVLAFSNSGNSGAASYTTGNVAFGDSTSFVGRNSNLAYAWGAIWGRALSADEHARAAADPGSIVEPLYEWSDLGRPPGIPYPLLYRGPNAGQGDL